MSDHRFLVYLCILSVTLTTAWSASAAVLVESGQGQIRNFKSADDGMSLRKIRRVGIGTSYAGALGMLGMNLELNFSSQWGAIGGYGGAPGYQAYTFQVKRVLAGEWLLPYMTAGYSKWYSVKSGHSLEKSNPEFLSKKFLTARERSTGVFSENILFPGFGLQYVQLSGPWAGTSVYLEVLGLIALDDFALAPTLTLGAFYYF